MCLVQKSSLDSQLMNLKMINHTLSFAAPDALDPDKTFKAGYIHLKNKKNQSEWDSPQTAMLHHPA